MKLWISPFLLLTVPALVWTASTSAKPTADRPSPAPAHRMYASASMTKLQVNSPTASDFGLFYRADDGSWLPFGPRVACSGLTILPGNSSVMFVPASDGVMRSVD